MKKVIIVIIIIMLTFGGAIVYKKSNIKENNETETFYATIEKITEYNGTYSLLVKGLEINDINARGEFSFVIKDTTKLLWRGTSLSITDLKEGQNVSITYDGIILTSYPAQIPNVLKIKILEDEI